MKTTGATYSMTANHFGISETRMIANWKAILMTNGVEALFRPKGGPQKDMKKSKLSKETKTLTRE